MARPVGTKTIKDPNTILEWYEAYVKQLKDNPILVHDYVGKDGNSVFRKKERPITMDGFYCYCYDNHKISIRNYFENQNGLYGDYSDICSHIKMRTRVEQIEGGMVGIYNNSITARLNGLVDKSEINQNVNINKLPDWLTNPIDDVQP